MILEEETFEAFGYEVWELKPQSGKLIKVACDNCGKIRTIRKSAYHALCGSCAQKGRIVTEEAKALQSAAMKGKNVGKKRTEEQKALQSAALKGNTCALGCTRSEEAKALMSAAKKGKNHPLFGTHRTEDQKAKQSAAMKGNTYVLGYKHTEEGKALISAAQIGEKNHNYNGGKKVAAARRHAKRRQLGHIPLNTYFKGCEGHHITHTFVIYIPKGLHKSIWHNLNTGQYMKEINGLALDFLVNGF